MAIDFQPDSSEVDFQPEEFDPSQIKLDDYQKYRLSHPNLGPMDTMGPVTTDLTTSLLHQLPKDIADLSRGSIADIASGVGGATEYAGNVPTVLRNVFGRADGSPDLALPIDEALSEAAAETQFRGEGTLVPTAARASQVISGMLPQLAVGNVPGAGGRLLMGAFTGQALMNAPQIYSELGEEYGKPEDQRDYDKISQLQAEALGNAAMVGLGAHSAAKSAPPIALTRGDALELGMRDLSRSIETAPLAEGSPAPIRRIGSRISENPLENPEVAPFVEQAFKELRGEHIFTPGERPAIEMMRLQENPIQLTPERNITGREGRLLESDPVRGLQYRTAEEGPGSLRTTENIRLEQAGGIPKTELKSGSAEQIMEVPFRSLEEQLLGRRVQDASSQPKATEVYGDVRQQPGQSKGEVPAEVSSSGVQPPRAPDGSGNVGGPKSEAKAAIIKPDDITVQPRGGKGLSEQWTERMLSKLGDKQTWKDVFDEVLNNRLPITNAAESIGMYLRKGGSSSLPMLREAMKARREILDEWKAKFDSTDPAVVEQAFAKVGGSQFFSEVVEAATRNDKTAKWYSGGKYDPIEIPKGEKAFDEIQSIRDFMAEQSATSKPMQVERVTSLEPASGVELSATDALINKLEGLKVKVENAGRLYSLPHPDAIAAIGKTAWNNTLDVAIAAIKGGRAVAQAIDDAIAYLKKNASGFDETKARNNLNYVLQNESKSGAPAGQQPNPTASATGGASGGGIYRRPPGIPGAPEGGVPANPQARASLDDVYRIFEPALPTKTPIREKVGEAVEAFRTGFSSKFRPLDKLAEDIAAQYGTPSRKGISGIFEQIKGSSGKAEADVYRFDQAVAKPLKGLEKDFNAYMFLRRTMDRLNQDAADVAAGNAPRRKVSNYTVQDMQAKLQTLSAKVGPETMQKFESAAGEYQRAMDQALQLQVTSGRMSSEVYNAIKSGNQFYAPFKVMKYIEESSRPHGTGKSIDTAAEYTKAMEGIEDPNFKLGDMLSAARQGIALSRILADKNNAMRRLTDLSGYDANGAFVKRLSASQKVPDGMGEIHSFQGGERVRYAVNKDVVDAVQIYGEAGQSILAYVLGKASIPFRAGATALNIPFQISNLLADQPRSALVSKYGINGVTDLVRYPMDFVQGLLSGIAGNVFGIKSKSFLDFLDSGAAGTTVQEYLTPNGLRFIEPANISKSKKLAMTVINSLPDFAQAIEQTSKIMGVQRAMRFHGVESGAELARQIPEAITEIRRFSGSPDFGRQGKWTEQARLNLLYMFLNARIQGTTADLGRLMGRDGAGTATKTWVRLMTAVGIPTVLAYLNNQSAENAEDYAKRPHQEKDNYWLIPKDTYITNETGEKIRDYWRIPKRESSKWISNMIESALQFAEKRDPQSFGKFAQNMIEDISPVNIQGDTFQERAESVAASLNPLLKAPLEAATGRDMYRHKDIVPDAQKKASPENQYTDRTSEVFKKLAIAMPDVAPEMFRSPLMLENMTKNLTAGLFTQFLPKKPVEGRTALENNPLLQRFQALPYTDSSEFEEKIGRFERESADEQLQRYRAANELMEANKGKDLQTIANAMVNKYGPDRKLLERVVDVWVANQRGIDSQERRVLALPVEQRAQYIIGELSATTPEEKGQLLQKYASKRILTEAVAEKMIEQGFRP